MAEVVDHQSPEAALSCLINLPLPSLSPSLSPPLLARLSPLLFLPKGPGGWHDPRHLDSAWVSVQLEDVNDNPPAFARPRAHVTVREDAAPGTLLDTLSAHDPDRVSLSFPTFYSLLLSSFIYLLSYLLVYLILSIYLFICLFLARTYLRACITNTVTIRKSKRVNIFSA